MGLDVAQLRHRPRRRCDDGRVTADRWSDLLALVAGAVGLLIVIRTWPRPPRRTQVARLRHPSAPPPVGLALDATEDAAHWRVTTPPDALPTTVDIVAWQPVGAPDEWWTEPIVDPIELGPGESALLPLVIDDPTTPHLVVVAWTVKHPGGDVLGSRTLTVDTDAPPAPVGAPAPHRHAGWILLMASALMTGLLVVLVLVAGWRVLDGESADGSGAATAAPTTEAGPRTTRATEPSVTAPSPTTSPMTAPVIVTASSTAATTAPTTTTTATTAPATATTAPPENTVDPTTSTTPTSDPDERSIVIRGRIEDCRFGADCLIASFSADGFPPEGDYVCEFDDGSRFAFRYAGGGGLDACATSGASPSITIEIDGVRSATITREALDGV